MNERTNGSEIIGPFHSAGGPIIKFTYRYQSFMNKSERADGQMDERDWNYRTLPLKRGSKNSSFDSWNKVSWESKIIDLIHQSQSSMAKNVVYAKIVKSNELVLKIC